jgi:hypothetical protein
MAVATDIEVRELRRQRREARRRQIRRRRLGAVAALAVALFAVFGLVKLIAGLGGTSTVTLTPVESVVPTSPFRAPLPEEIRGVHVTGPLMTLKGKLDGFIALKKYGLNTIELDVKDETGNVAFTKGAPSIALKNGAALPYYDPHHVVQKVHNADLYLIGRVVTFEDPITSVSNPALALRRGNGSVWKNSGGLGWLSPYSRAAWKYDVDVAVAAAKAGFDEIQFDYVRFPSDGDVTAIRYPAGHEQQMRRQVAAFLRYAVGRLHPLGVRVSADVFGLSATHDLGIGQYPSQISQVVDTIYPMTYPSHYRSGEYNLPNPDAAPGTTVDRSLRDFRAKLEGGNAALVPWLQDFSLGRQYSLGDVKAQISSARLHEAAGFMLWNAGGVYTPEALRSGPVPPLPTLAAPQL